MLDKVVLSFESVDEILKCNHSKLMKATELNFCGAVYCAVRDVSVESSDFAFPVMDYRWRLRPKPYLFQAGGTQKRRNLTSRSTKRGGKLIVI